MTKVGVDNDDNKSSTGKHAMEGKAEKMNKI
jgi:hypothetical protein